MRTLLKPALWTCGVSQVISKEPVRKFPKINLNSKCTDLVLTKKEPSCPLERDVNKSK